ncbi:ribonuclease HII [Candidatus Microgenomates bacterium]|nr:ribonuclease HII [Candidatus Microgenomates bacterium]
MLPDFSFETKLWQEKISLIAGVDEVGRGALAGPLVAAGVVFKPYCKNIKKLKINDSKKLTWARREELVKEIKERCLFWSVSEITVEYINRYGIGPANRLAILRAIEGLKTKIGEKLLWHYLIDGYGLKNRAGKPYSNQTAIIGGDQKAISIAAASIVAKVYRDHLMADLAKNFTAYGWETNKGYGTKRHWEAINKFGLTKHHRLDFVD